MSAAAKEFIIGPEDVLEIHVWKQPDISATVPVRSDGKISTPLINEIQAAGYTPSQLKDNITERLLKFIDDPTVSVIVTEINSLKISVSGNVTSPGVYKISENINIVDAISLAGGLERRADSKRIRILRNENGIDKVYQVNYHAIFSDGDLKQNAVIYPGDSIMVP
jgi:polysaccharide export outer membrane protein